MPWDLDALRRYGIRAVLSVNDGRMVHMEDLAKRNIAYACIPLSENAPPREGDAEVCRVALPRAYRFVTGQMDREQAVLVHCSSGKDRTGLFLCYFLMRHFGWSLEKALCRVHEVRLIALSAEGWREFSVELLSHGI